MPISKGSESKLFNERYGINAHERAVRLGIPLPVFYAHDVDVEYYQRQLKQQELRKQEEQLEERERRRQEEQQEQQEHQKQREQQQQELQKQEKQRRRKELRQHQKLRKQQDSQNQRNQQDAQVRQQPHQHANEMQPPGYVISLPSIRPQLYPPPGAREKWSQQQDMEWQYQLYIQVQQDTYQQENQGYQNQHRQWQAYYRQHQLRYWHQQEAQRFAILAPFAVPAPVDQPDLSAQHDLFVAASDPVAAAPGLVVASLGSLAEPAASLAAPPPLPTTEPSLKRPLLPSPSRGRTEPFVNGSRHPLNPPLASGRLPPGHRNDHVRPVAPPLQPGDAVIGPPPSLVGPAMRSEPLKLPATTVFGLPHGLPVPQSSFASDNIAWPVLGEAEFAKMMRGQQEPQQQGEGLDYVCKCE